MKPTLSPFKKSTILLFGSIFGFFIALGIYFYVQHVVVTSNAHTLALQEEVSALQREEAEVGKLKINFASTNLEQQTLSSYFVDVNDPVPFFETIESYGKSTNVKTAFTNVAITPNTKSLDTTLTVSGSFSDVYHFLQLLETAPYEFVITGTSLQLGTTTPDPAVKKAPQVTQWEAHIQLSVFSVSGIK